MTWLHHLRWKLFVSHVLTIVVGVVVLLLTAHFLAGTPLVQEAPLTLGAAASETGQLAPPLSESDLSQPARFQAVVDQSLLIAALAALTTAIFISLFVSRRVVEPLQELTAISRTFSSASTVSRSHATGALAAPALASRSRATLCMPRAATSGSKVLALTKARPSTSPCRFMNLPLPLSYLYVSELLA